MYGTLAALAGFVLLYSLSSRGLERTPINGAILFCAFGFIFGPLGLDYLKLDPTVEDLRILAELALALLLFTDAANADLRVLKGSIGIPRRLLVVGLPLTIALGIGAGFLLFDGLTMIEIAIIATMLAPTDAALGKAVVSDPSVPARIRQGLNVESGLNDGICVPILFLFLALATRTGGDESATSLALSLLAEEIGIGVGVGILFTVTAVWLLKQCAQRGWITESWRQLPVAALAVACFAGAQSLGGSGFIASFAGGLLFGPLAGKKKEELLLAAEGTGDTLALITWIVFGSAVIGHTVGNVTWEALLYSVLSLTVIRMLPVFLVLSGFSLRAGEKLFIGWFGPRGLASIVFAVIVMNGKLPGEDTIMSVVVCTIVLSVIAHGLSARPLVARLVK